MVEQQMNADGHQLSAAVLSQLAMIVHPEKASVETMRLVAGLAQELVATASEVSVTAVEGGSASTVAFTGSRAAALDERQYRAKAGPCLHAATSGVTTTVVMADPPAEFAEFAAAAARAGVTHSLSVPLPVAESWVGALNLYTDAEQPFSAEEAWLAEAFAAHVAVFVINLTHYQQANRLAEQLQLAMDTRAVIEQAKGIVMATQRCTAEQAFSVLTNLSQQRNIKLNQIAAALVTRTSRP